MIKTILIASLLLIGIGASAQESFEGVGIVLSQKDGITHVESTLKNSPAENAGIQPQELIKAVDGVSIVNADLQKIVSKIRGPAGTQVILTMADSQNQHERNVTMIRIKFVLDCFMEGSYHLTTNSFNPGHPTLLTGMIGDQSIEWNISGNSIVAPFKGEFVNLSFMQNGQSIMIMGTIHNQRVQWNGMANVFSGYQACIE